MPRHCRAASRNPNKYKWSSFLFRRQYLTYFFHNLQTWFEKRFFTKNYFLEFYASQTLFESFPIIPILFICYKENCNLFFIYLYLSIKNRKNKLQISLYQMKRIGMIGKDLKRVWEAKNSKNYFFVKTVFRTMFTCFSFETLTLNSSKSKADFPRFIA